MHGCWRRRTKAQQLNGTSPCPPGNTRWTGNSHSRGWPDSVHALSTSACKQAYGGPGTRRRTSTGPLAGHLHPVSRCRESHRSARGGSWCRSRRYAIAPSSWPTLVLYSSQLPMNPRRSSGAYSAMKAIAGSYSPPVEKPCTSRQTSMSIGAATPMVA